MFEILEHSFIETLEISILVFIALVVMDLIYIYSRGKFATFLQKRPGTQYFISSLLGAIPGCGGVYFAISLHTHGLVSFGALLSAFIATTGDEAYVMISRSPMLALGISALLMALGYIIGWSVDIFRKRVNSLPHSHCEAEIFHPGEEFRLSHYFKEHLWSHIIKKHMFKIISWTFIAILIIELAVRNFDLASFIEANHFWILVIAGLWGLIPQSGPHIIFLTMFIEQTIPFSIFFTNMFVQNGHALLPLLAISVRDSITIKAIGLGFGVLIGSLLFSFGL